MLHWGAIHGLNGLGGCSTSGAGVRKIDEIDEKARERETTVDGLCQLGTQCAESISGWRDELRITSTGTLAPNNCATYSPPKKEGGCCDVSAINLLFIFGFHRYKTPTPTFRVALRHTSLSLFLHHDPSFWSSNEAEPKPPWLNVSRPLHRLGSRPLVPRCSQRCR